MEKVTYKIVLDAKKGGNQQRLSGFYYGESGTREVEVILIKDSEPFHVDSENTVIVYGEKADGSTFMQSCEIRNSNVVFTPFSSVFSVSGEVSCQLQILDSNGKILFSPSFIIEVCDTVRNEEAIESSDELSYLDEVIRDVETLRILSGADTDVLSDISEEDGVLTFGGERVDKQVNEKCENLHEMISDTKETVNELQGISHSHDNRSVIEGIGEQNGKLTYNGELIGNDFDISSELDTKVDKENGKSLIADTEIKRLSSLKNYDDSAIRAEIGRKADKTDLPTNISELGNDAGYQTATDVNLAISAVLGNLEELLQSI